MMSFCFRYLAYPLKEFDARLKTSDSPVLSKAQSALLCLLYSPAWDLHGNGAIKPATCNRHQL